VRLVTLTGTGGIGKTRLALQVATDLRGDFADGVCCVSLAALDDPGLVVSTIAQMLGLKESEHRTPLDLVQAALRDKRLLLLLDNFERLLLAAPQLIALLTCCPQLKILVTSRAVLHVQGEYEYPVSPLALPELEALPALEALASIPAVALFLKRAQAVRPTFRLTEENARAIAEVCVRLDGLPLALELAAARSKLLTPQELLARLAHRLQVLTGGPQDLPPRQQTLRNTILWSYQLLPAREQRLFRRLSVFAGGCTLEAAETVCAALDGDEGEGYLLEPVSSLLDKNLLRTIQQEGKESRLVMLETIREYGLECLTASGEEEVTRQDHAAYYLALAEEAEPHLFGAEQDMWLKRLERDQGNLRAAQQWLVSGQASGKRKEMALRLANALARFWDVQNRWGEGSDFLERALVGSEETVTRHVRAKALETALFIALNRGDSERAEVLCEESLAVYQQLGDKRGIGQALQRLGQLARTKGNFAAARSLLEEALILYREVGNMWYTAQAIFQLGLLEEQQGAYVAARARFEESLALYREVGDKQRLVNSLYWLASMLLNQGDASTAAALLEEGLKLAMEVGYKVGQADCLRALCEVALCQGGPAAARRRALESVGLLRDIGGRDDQVAASLMCLGRVETRQGNFAPARACYEESLALARKGDFKEELAAGLEGLACVVAAQGVLSWAVRLWGAADRLHEATGIPIAPVYRADYERSVAAIRAQLGEQAFAAGWAEGRMMTLEQVLSSGEPAVISTSGMEDRQQYHEY
jgi:predicted ATPase